MADLPETRSKKPIPKTEKAVKGLSVLTIMKSTPAYIRNRARDEIVVKKLATVWTKGGMRAIRAVAVNMTLHNPTPKVVTIIGLDVKANVATKVKKSQVPKVILQKRVLVDCTCEFFKFYSEVALWSHGAAKIRHSNGEHPGVTNPGLVPLGCKHVYAVMKLLKQNVL